MVVQHNMQAANANRMLGLTVNDLSKSTEKLSSGYRINRAADDAAGLSISEKMRKQIRGLDRASTNAQDGVSAVQTAEGALTEVHSMLQRMNELAVQAANGTNSESDRDAIQSEVDQLLTEIDRVAETTKFNETYLLNGGSAGSNVKEYFDHHDAGLKGSWEYPDESLWESGICTFTLDSVPGEGDKVVIGGVEVEIVADGSSEADGKKKMESSQFLEKVAQELGKANTTIGKGSVDNVGDGTFTVEGKAVKNIKLLSLDLHVGADADMTNKIIVDIKAMNANALGLQNLKVDGSDSTRATYAVDVIEAAITKVSTQRSALGAVQNRLEHTIANVDNVVENTTAAESRIRDVDMAEEMVSYSKNNILQQAGQSMLAQANQANQGVLSLLQ